MKYNKNKSERSVTGCIRYESNVHVQGGSSKVDKWGSRAFKIYLRESSGPDHTGD